MPYVATVGLSMTSGHDSCSPVQATTPNQSIVEVNGRMVQVVGGQYQPHGCSMHSTHTPVATSGSSLVDIEGIPVVRVTDKVESPMCSGQIVVTGDDLIDIQE